MPSVDTLSHDLLLRTIRRSFNILLELIGNVNEIFIPMSSPSRIELYKEAIAIEQERTALQSKVDQLQSRLASLSDSLISKGGTAPAQTVFKSAAPARPAASPRAQHGELKQRILGALAAAGDAGMAVRDLATALGAKSSALHSWFQFARKSIKGVRKAGRGRYRFVGAAPAAAPAAPQAKLAKAGRKPARPPRGYLSVAIQAALKAAGKDGMGVHDLAKSLGLDPRNLFVWFSTAGKKLKAIKKVSPGHYRLQG